MCIYTYIQLLYVCMYTLYMSLIKMQLDCGVSEHLTLKFETHNIHVYSVHVYIYRDTHE